MNLRRLLTSHTAEAFLVPICHSSAPDSIFLVEMYIREGRKTKKKSNENPRTRKKRHLVERTYMKKNTRKGTTNKKSAPSAVTATLNSPPSTRHIYVPNRQRRSCHLTYHQRNGSSTAKAGPLHRKDLPSCPPTCIYMMPRWCSASRKLSQELLELEL